MAGQKHLPNLVNDGLRISVWRYRWKKQYYTYIVSSAELYPACQKIGPFLTAYESDAGHPDIGGCAYLNILFREASEGDQRKLALQPCSVTLVFVFTLSGLYGIAVTSCF